MRRNRCISTHDAVLAGFIVGVVFVLIESDRGRK